jgi:hypothetical protein
MLFPGIDNCNVLEAHVEFQSAIPQRLLAPSRDGYQPCAIHVFADDNWFKEEHSAAPVWSLTLSRRDGIYVSMCVHFLSPFV